MDVHNPRRRTSDIRTGARRMTDDDQFYPEKCRLLRPETHPIA